MAHRARVGLAHTGRGELAMSGHGTISRRVALLVVAFTAALAPAAAHAATIPVNSTADTADPTSADRRLRRGGGALHAARGNPDREPERRRAGHDHGPGIHDRSLDRVATEDASVDGDLDIAHDPSTPAGQPDLIINGAGMGSTIVDAHQHDRVFQVLKGASAVITGLTMRGGQPFWTATSAVASMPTARSRWTESRSPTTTSSAAAAAVQSTRTWRPRRSSSRTAG